MATDTSVLTLTVTPTESRIEDEPDYMQVLPVSINIKAGDQVEFHFVGCRAPRVMIPEEGVFTEQIGWPDKETPDVIRMNVSANPTASKSDFPYAIYSPGFYGFGEGNSPPRMVLDSPPDT